MGVAAYNTVLKKGGTSTAFTGEAFTLVSGNTYQITNTAKRVWDPAQSLTIYDNGSPVTLSTLTIDWLFGRVTFPSPPTTPITADGNYIPTAILAKAREYSISVSRDVLENTDYETAGANGGFGTKQLGLLDVSGSITRIDDLTKTFKDHVANSDLVMIEITPGGGVEIIRGWYVLESAGSEGSVEDLETEPISFTLATNDEASFSWR